MYFEGRADYLNVFGVVYDERRAEMMVGTRGYEWL
jgi:hypothetical protein